MDFSVNLLHTMEKDMKFGILQVLKAANVSSAEEIDESVLMKVDKDTLIIFVNSLVSLVEKNLELCKLAANKVDEMKSELIENQKELLKKQQDQIDSVQKTVKTEIKSWADVVKKNNNQTKLLTTKTVKEAVRAVNNEEERSRNFIIYGLEEIADEEEEDLPAIVCGVYDRTGFSCPAGTTDIYRLGKKTADKARPIKVEMETPGDVQFMLKNAYKLRADEHFKLVYLAPDRTKEERKAHGKLINEMKELIKQDSSKHYFIRDNKVKSADKTLSTG